MADQPYTREQLDEKFNQIIEKLSELQLHIQRDNEGVKRQKEQKLIYVKEEAETRNKLLEERLDAIAAKIATVKKEKGIIDPSTLTLHPDARLPLGFKFPKMDKYDGTGSPVKHLMDYARGMKLQGADGNLMCEAFFYTLTGSAKDWFYGLDKKIAGNWEDLCIEFTKRYEHNQGHSMTRRELETTKQRPEENIYQFIMRWRNKAAEVREPISLKDQIDMVLRCLLPMYQERLCTWFPDFHTLIEAGGRVEEFMASGAANDEGSLPKSC